MEWEATVLTTDDDGAPDANPVIVVSYDFWKSKLGGTSGVVGRKLPACSFGPSERNRGSIEKGIRKANSESEEPNF